MSPHSTSRIISRDIIVALLVLALALLNFGHASISIGGEYRVSHADGWCGDPLSPGSLQHAPCHACRSDSGAAVPPAPAVAAPVSFAVATVIYASPAMSSLDPALFRLAQPRGPPALV